MKTIIFTNKHGNIFRIDNMELEQAVEKYRPSIGEDARWLPSYLEGVESREVIDRPYSPQYTIDEGVLVAEQEGLSHMEYLHPAEYTYEIIEETLEQVKANKKKELAGQSELANPYIHGNLAYRVSNLSTDYYIRKGLVDKHIRYTDDYAAKSDKCLAELARCNAAVDAATTEAEVLAVTFKVVFEVTV